MDIRDTLYVPTVSVKENNTEKYYDVFSMLLKNRIIMIGQEITSDLAQIVVSELLYLDSVSTDPIHMYINSPGGSVIDGLSIVDTMDVIKSPVYTYTTGLAASMGSVLFSKGEKGHRYILPHASVMLHQASAGMKGNVQDMKISYQQTEKMNEMVLTILAESCGKTLEELKDLTIRDLWLDANQSIEFGIADEILKR